MRMRADGPVSVERSFVTYPRMDRNKLRLASWASLPSPVSPWGEAQGEARWRMARRAGHGARRACFFRNIQSGSRAAGGRRDGKALAGGLKKKAVNCNIIK